MRAYKENKEVKEQVAVTGAERVALIDWLFYNQPERIK